MTTSSKSPKLQLGEPNDAPQEKGIAFHYDESLLDHLVKKSYP